MDKQKRKRGQEGFTLIEVMMAMIILGIGIFAIVGLQTKNMAYNSSSKRQTEGYTLAMDQVEKLVALKYDDVKEPINPVSQGAYTVNWTVTDGMTVGASVVSKTVDVRVNWNNREVAQINFTRTKTSF